MDSLRSIITRLRGTFLGRLFIDKRFAAYTGVGIFVSICSIALLWFLIDVLGIGTVKAGVVATVTIFLLRYVLLMVFKIV